jgi:hypothetical protein
MIQKISTILLSFQNNYTYWYSIEDFIEKRSPVFQDKKNVYSSSSHLLDKASISPTTIAIAPDQTTATRKASACKK